MNTRDKIGVMFTGGNPADGRVEDDFYPTPSDVTEALLAVETFNGFIWEPCCGDGAVSKVFERNGYSVINSDINPRCKGMVIDFLDDGVFPYAPNIVTNPPFKLAEKMIRKAHKLKAKKIAMVLKATYWHAKNRIALFEEHPPARIYALTWRPDFLNKGAPTMDVQWCVWDSEYIGATQYKLLKKGNTNVQR